MSAEKILFKSFYWKIFQNLSSIAVNILFARTLQAAGIGTFFSLLYVMALCSGFFALGLDVGLNYYLSKRGLSVSKARTLIVWTTAGGTLLSALCMLLYYLQVPSPITGSGQMVLFAVLQVSGTLLITLTGAIFASRGKFHWPLALSLFFNVILVVLAILLPRWIDRSRWLPVFCLMYFLSTFLQGILLLVCTGFSFFRQGEVPAIPARAVAVIRFSLSAFLINFLFFLGTRMTVYWVPHWTDPSSSGNYLLAFKMVEYLLAIVSMVYYPFMALVAGEKTGAAEQRVLFLIRLSNSFVFLSGALLVMTGRFLFPAVFGQSFDRSYGIFLVCLPGLLTGSASTFFTAYYFGTARLRINLTSAVILILTSLVLSGLLMPRWPLYGAAWTFSVANLAAFVYEMTMFRRIAPFSPTDLLLLNRPDFRQSLGLIRRPPPRGEADHFPE